MATNYIFVISRLFSVKFYIRIFFGIIFAILFFFKTNIANPNTTKTSNLKKYDLKNTNKVTISNNYFISQKHKTFNTLFNQSTLTINSCYIYSCIFKKGIDLSTSKITGKTDCQFNNFNNADFFQVFFENSAIFSSSIFLGNSTFDKCIFFRDANFDLSTFKGPTTFTKCTFYGNAKFNDSNFSNSADFQFVTFKGNLDLSHSKFNNNVDFSQATINNTLDIRGTKFTIAKFSGTDFHNLKTIYVDNETSFEKGEFIIDWEAIKKANILASKISSKDDKEVISEYDHLSTFYNKLKNNYLAQGNTSSADNVSYELCKLRAKYKNNFFWNLYGIFMGWGYESWRIYALSLLIIILFSFLWLKNHQKHVHQYIFEDNNNSNKYHNNNSDIKSPIKIFHSLLYSANVFLSISFDKNWSKSDDTLFIALTILEWLFGKAIYTLYIYFIYDSALKGFADKLFN